MLKAITDFFTKEKREREAEREELDQRIKVIEQLITEKEAATAVVTQQLEEANQKLFVYESEAEKEAGKHSSTDPWVVIKGDTIDPIKGMVLELDWNDAFIEYLKDNGITAKDELTVVQKWIAMLYENLVNNINERVIDKSDIPRPSDFA